MAGHSSLRTDWDLGRLSVNLIEGSSSFPPRPDFFRIYILDEDNRLVSHVWLASGSVDNWLAGKRYELRADEIEFLGNPILYRTPKPLNDGIMLESMVIFRAKNIKADGKERVSLSDFEERVLAQTWPERQRIAWEIDLAYLKSRYGTEGLGDVANDYSPTAMQQAFARIHPNSEALREEFIRFTPVVPAPALAQVTGASEVWIKDESVQYTWSFKPRGAFNRLSAYLEKAEAKENEMGRSDAAYTPKTGQQIAEETAVVAASHGNHAQGVIWVANKLGFKETLLVLPLHSQTQKVKIRSCLKMGAFVMLHGKNLDDAMNKAEKIRREGLQAHVTDVVYLPATATDAEIDNVIRQGKSVILYGDPSHGSTGSPRPDGHRVPDGHPEPVEGWVEEQVAKFSKKITFVHTYDHAQVSMGQATDAMELIGWMPHLQDGAFTYAVGAGGLGKLAGEATYLRMVNPGARIFGVNREGVPAFARSLEEGRYSLRDEEVSAPEVATFADGVDVPRIGRIPLEQILKLNAEHPEDKPVSAALVTEDEIAEALVYAISQKWYGDRAKLIEGAPAAVLAAALNGALGDLNGRRLVISVTGSNIDEATLDRAFAKKGWVAESGEFYAFVTSIREKLRGTKGKKAAEWIKLFNGMLEDREMLKTLKYHHATGDEGELFDRVMRYLWVVKKLPSMAPHAGRFFLDKTIGDENFVSAEGLSSALAIAPKSYRIIDVRRDKVVRESGGGIEGATDISIDDPDFEGKLKRFPRDVRLLFVSRIGLRALKAAFLARLLGFKHVSVLEGGMAAWNRHLFIEAMKREGEWSEEITSAKTSRYRDSAGRNFQIWTTRKEKLVVRLAQGAEEGVAELFAKPAIREAVSRFQKSELMRADGSLIPVAMPARAPSGGRSGNGRSTEPRRRHAEGTSPAPSAAPKVVRDEPSVDSRRAILLRLLALPNQPFIRWLGRKGFRAEAKRMVEGGVELSAADKLRLIRAMLSSRERFSQEVDRLLSGKGADRPAVAPLHVLPAIPGAAWARPVVVPIGL